MTNWYPGAAKYLGPSWKNRGSTNSVEGVVWHSAEGSWYGLTYELARSDRGAAWHFSCLKSGALFQHYPVNAVLWHAGDWGDDQDGANGNGECVGIEFEGVAGEPLTTAQINTAIKLVQWLAEKGGWEPIRKAAGVQNQWEHNELSNLGTECPSDRIPWPVIMREFDKIYNKEPDVALSPDIDPEHPLLWPAIFDAIYKAPNGIGEYVPLPQTSPGVRRYEFRLKY